jgi:hypothetical protein
LGILIGDTVIEWLHKQLNDDLINKPYGHGIPSLANDFDKQLGLGSGNHQGTVEYKVHAFFTSLSLLALGSSVTRALSNNGQRSLQLRNAKQRKSPPAKHHHFPGISVVRVSV